MTAYVHPVVFVAVASLSLSAALIVWAILWHRAGRLGRRFDVIDSGVEREPGVGLVGWADVIDLRTGVEGNVCLSVDTADPRVAQETAERHALRCLASHVEGLR